jgi:hypothetical protein
MLRTVLVGTIGSLFGLRSEIAKPEVSEHLPGRTGLRPAFGSLQNRPLVSNYQASLVGRARVRSVDPPRVPTSHPGR